MPLYGKEGLKCLAIYFCVDFFSLYINFSGITDSVLFLNEIMKEMEEEIRKIPGNGSFDVDRQIDFINKSFVYFIFYPEETYKNNKEIYKFYSDFLLKKENLEKIFKIEVKSYIIDNVSFDSCLHYMGYSTNQKDFEVKQREKVLFILNFMHKLGCYLREQDKIYNFAELKNEYERLASIEALLSDLDSYVLYLQPIVNREQKVVMYESLLRIKSEFGLIYPKDFLFLLEKFSYYWDFEEWLYYKTKEYKETLQVPISVNLYLDENSVKKSLFLNKPEEGLVYEITERVLANALNVVEESLIDARKKGVFIFLDDFGEGDNSLLRMRVKKKIFNGVKLGVNFVRELDINDSTQTAMVREIVELGKKIDMKECVEGIETDDTFKFFKKMKADYYQGYYFGRPEDAEKIIKNHTATNNRKKLIQRST